MSSEKIVFQSAEERELWQRVYVSAAQRPIRHIDEVTGQVCPLHYVADRAVAAYRARCGTSEGEAWDRVNKAAGDAGCLAGMDIPDFIRSLAAAKQKAEAELAELRAKRDAEGPWTLWVPEEHFYPQAFSTTYERRVRSGIIAFFDRNEADQLAAAYKQKHGYNACVATFPRTPEEYRNGPGAGGGA